MNKQDLIKKIKNLQDITADEKAYLIELVNTKKKYGLVWEDKPEDVEEQLRSMLPVFKEVKERAIISEDKEAPNHILIEGDNLHALTALTYTHEGKIDVIYIDPPYNTGNRADDGTTDFKYNDDYVDSNDEYRHSKWLSFMEKRLKLAKKLLSSDGFLAVSIDDNEIAQLKILLDNLFNQNTKIIAVKMSEASGLKMGATNRIKNIPKYKEYLIFARLEGIRDLDIELIKKEEWDNEYNLFINNFSKSDRRFIDENCENPDQNTVNKIDKILKNIELQSVKQKIKDLNIDKKSELEWKYENSWRIVRTAASASVKKLADNKRKTTDQIYFSVVSSRDKILYIVKGDYSSESKSPRVQFLFADTNLMVHPGDFWQDIKTTGLEAEGGVEFKNGKKPLKLLNRILNAHLNKNVKILDFFAGSGSTFHSAIELNNQDKGKREVILVTNNENDICENITYQRVCNVIKGYNSYKGNEINNLRYFKADFVPSQKTEKNRRLLTARSTDLLCIKEDCFLNHTKDFGLDKKQAQIFTNGLGKYMVVIYYTRNQEEIIEQLNDIIANLETEEKVRVYAFSPEKELIEDDLFKVADKIEAVPLPDSIYNAFRATFRTLKLDKKEAVGSNQEK